MVVSLKLSRRWLVIPPIVVGVAILAIAVANGKPLNREPLAELARPLRVAAATPRELAPVVVGYGTAQPTSVWTAVTEVSGRLVDVHPKLDAGERVRQGELLLRIDPTDYQLRVDQLEAELTQANAMLRETEQRLENEKALLEIEEESLRLTESELARMQKLASRAAASASDLDLERRSRLTQLRQVQSIRNTIAVLPVQIDNQRAAIKLTQSKLDEAKRNLERTRIIAPFEGRLAEVTLEPGQVVATGERLFELHADDAMEIEAQFPLDKVRELFTSRNNFSSESGQAVLTQHHWEPLRVMVRARDGNTAVEWVGKVTRVRERLDEVTRTLGVVVEVSNRGEGGQPSAVPDLLKGTFCEVELIGEPRRESIVIPRVALAGKNVYIVDDENRLSRRPVNVDFIAHEEVRIESGIEPGERVVITDPTPAVEGMLVDPIVESPGGAGQRVATTVNR
ncbi:Multidrug resistance protein MdtA precursor [Planctomycetes bacterium Pan216]|uniref:Multidrug resistance protein MdtA n=1 Tax=Kolteria novifilia TaxID=2527975 RepID=A0A518AZC2_9BACT|nr:Multidrug resistance protein MdtA precursor [Planctomycetes bacterium Pan216]